MIRSSIHAPAARVALLATALLATLACARQPTEGEVRETRHSTVPAEERAVELRAPLVGVVEYGRTVRLVALADARVVAVAVADGGRVEAGGLVFRLGGERLDATLEAVLKGVAGAGEAVAARGVQLERARRRAAAHLAAPGELAEAETALVTAERELADGEERGRRLAAARELRAPCPGRLVDRRVAEGQEVTAGTELGTVADESSLRVVATLLATAEPELRAGQDAWIQTASGAGITLRVTGVGAVAASGGTARVWLEGAGLAGVAPGTGVGGWIVVGRRRGVVVPARAVVRDDRDRPFVFVGAAAPYSRRAVTPGVELGEDIELVDGVAAGEPVVVDGAFELLWASFSTEFKEPD